MNLDKLFNLGALIVGVALVTTLVSHSGTAGTVKAFGDAFSGALRAAQGA
jgi:hypothetical protein